MRWIFCSKFALFSLFIFVVVVSSVEAAWPWQNNEPVLPVVNPNVSPSPPSPVPAAENRRPPALDMDVGSSGFDIEHEGEWVKLDSPVSPVVHESVFKALSHSNQRNRPGLSISLGPRAFIESRSLIFDVLFRAEKWRQINNIIPKEFSFEVPLIFNIKPKITIKKLTILEFKRPISETIIYTPQGIRVNVKGADFVVSLKVAKMVGSLEAFVDIVASSTNTDFSALLVPHFVNVRNRTSQLIERKLFIKVDESQLTFNSALKAKIVGAPLQTAAPLNALLFVLQRIDAWLLGGSVLNNIISHVLVDLIKVHVPRLSSDFMYKLVGDIFGVIDKLLQAQYDVNVDIAHKFSFHNGQTHFASNSFDISSDMHFDFVYDKDPEQYVKDLLHWFYSPLPKHWSGGQDPHERVHFYDDPNYKAYESRTMSAVNRVKTFFHCIGEKCKFMRKKPEQQDDAPLDSKADVEEIIASRIKVKPKKTGRLTRFREGWKNFWRRIFGRRKQDKVDDTDVFEPNEPMRVVGTHKSKDT